MAKQGANWMKPQKSRGGRCTPGLLLAVLAIAGLVGALVVPIGAASQEPESLAGQYTVAISSDELPTDLPGGPSLTGRWRVTFGDDGTYSLFRTDIGEVVSGSYTLEGEQLTVTDEAGLLSCANLDGTASGDVTVATATYSWNFEGEDLVLLPIEEECRTREVLLSIRPLALFVACLVEPLALGPIASPVGEGTPGLEATPIASPNVTAESGGLAGALRESGTPISEDVRLGDHIASGPEAAIDDLLAQLTACWVTGDPARILPLFADAFLEELIDTIGPEATIEDVVEIFTQFMSAPVTWERAGALEFDGPTRAQAVVIIRLGAEEQFQRFQFVFNDGQWRLADFGTPATEP